VWQNQACVSVALVISPWMVALVVAALAPSCVRILEAALEARLGRRTLDVIARASRSRPKPPPTEPPQPPQQAPE
jgi:hypothetical protein